jgi:hypothetical protein
MRAKPKTLMQQASLAVLRLIINESCRLKLAVPSYCALLKTPRRQTGSQGAGTENDTVPYRTPLTARSFRRCRLRHRLSPLVKQGRSMCQTRNRGTVYAGLVPCYLGMAQQMRIGMRFL